MQKTYSVVSCILLTLVISLFFTPSSMGDWSKPFDKGGPLHVDKVHVPKRLKIGKPKTLVEVINPYCWGTPQSCRNTNIRNKKKTDKIIQSYPFYITGRFLCRNKSNGRLSGTSCDTSQFSSISCGQAKVAMKKYLSDHDPCQTCSRITDPTIYWNGDVEYIQGGLCQGW